METAYKNKRERQAEVLTLTFANERSFHKVKTSERDKPPNGNTRTIANEYIYEVSDGFKQDNNSEFCILNCELKSGSC